MVSHIGEGIFCSRGQYNQHHIDDNNTTNMKQNKLKIWSLTCEERWRRLSLRLFVRAFALQTFFWRQAVLELETFLMPFHSSTLCIWLNVNGCPRFMKARENAVAGSLYWLCWACLHAHAGSLIVFNLAWSSLKNNLFWLFFIFKLLV